MVSIIIVSYNTKQLLSDCLTSLPKHLKGFSYEVVVVDNASSDGTVEMVRKKFEWVKLVKNPQNEGFTKGNNTGVTKAKGDYILFLNSDTQVLDDSVQKMYDFLRSHKHIAVVGGRLIDSKGETQRSFSRFYNLTSVFFLLFGGFGHDAAEKIASNHNRSQETDWVSGGILMVKKSVFDEVGGFDENIFMYTEDMELCYRIKKNGLKVYFLADTKILHAGHGSSNRGFAIAQIYKGILYFYKKHKTKSEYTIVRHLLLVKAYGAIIIGYTFHRQYLVNTYKGALLSIS